MANYILRGSVTATDNVGSTYTALNGGAVTSGTLMGTSGGTGNFVLISTGGGIQDALYFFFTGSVIGKSYMPAYRYGSLYYPYDGQNMEYVASNYTDSNGVYHYRGTVYNINRSTGARNYTMWSWDITIITSPSYATIIAPKGCDITFNPVDGEAKTIPAGTTGTVTIYGDSTEATLTASVHEYFTFWNWSKNSTVYSFNPWTTTVADGDVITCDLRYERTIEIVIIAPPQSAINWQLGYESADKGSGTVSAGSSIARSITLTDADKGFTLLLTALSFNLATFQGWTLDGTIVDRWSNPATMLVDSPGTYSCIIANQSPPPPPSILCNRYGNILYADKLDSGINHTVQIDAIFAGSGTHNLHWEMSPNKGEEITGYRGNVSGHQTVSEAVSFSPTGNDSGVPIYADGIVALRPRLLAVKFHCEQPVHEYDLIVRIDGATVYEQTAISGTFSRTFEV